MSKLRGHSFVRYFLFLNLLRNVLCHRRILNLSLGVYLVLRTSQMSVLLDEEALHDFSIVFRSVRRSSV